MLASGAETIRLLERTSGTHSDISQNTGTDKILNASVGCQELQGNGFVVSKFLSTGVVTATESAAALSRLLRRINDRLQRLIDGVTQLLRNGLLQRNDLHSDGRRRIILVDSLDQFRHFCQFIRAALNDQRVRSNIGKRSYAGSKSRTFFVETLQSRHNL
jgi:hypothetical protein